MTDLYKNIKQLREAKGLSQDALAKLTGYTDRSSIAKIEKGLVDLQQSKIELFAKALGTSAKDLVGWDNITTPSKRGVVINVLGRVAAGIPIEAMENIIDTEEISEDMAKTGEFFGLRIKGDSMEPDIHSGDTVIVRQQDDAENDEIVIALINGNDGVCKRLKKYESSISYIDIYDLADKLREKLEKDFESHFSENEARDATTMFSHIYENQIFYKTYFKLGYDERFFDLSFFG